MPLNSHMKGSLSIKQDDEVVTDAIITDIYRYLSQDYEEGDARQMVQTLPSKDDRVERSPIHSFHDQHYNVQNLSANNQAWPAYPTCPTDAAVIGTSDRYVCPVFYDESKVQGFKSEIPFDSNGVGHSENGGLQRLDLRPGHRHPSGSDQIGAHLFRSNSYQLESNRRRSLAGGSQQNRLNGEVSAIDDVRNGYETEPIVSNDGLFLQPHLQASAQLSAIEERWDRQSSRTEMNVRSRSLSPSDCIAGTQRQQTHTNHSERDYCEEDEMSSLASEAFLADKMLNIHILNEQKRKVGGHGNDPALSDDQQRDQDLKTNARKQLVLQTKDEPKLDKKGSGKKIASTKKPPVKRRDPYKTADVVKETRKSKPPTRGGKVRGAKNKKQREDPHKHTYLASQHHNNPGQYPQRSDVSTDAEYLAAIMIYEHNQRRSQAQEDKAVEGHKAAQQEPTGGRTVQSTTASPNVASIKSTSASADGNPDSMGDDENGIMTDSSTNICKVRSNVSACDQRRHSLQPYSTYTKMYSMDPSLWQAHNSSRSSGYDQNSNQTPSIVGKRSLRRAQSDSFRTQPSTHYASPRNPTGPSGQFANIHRNASTRKSFGSNLSPHAMHTGSTTANHFEPWRQQYGREIGMPQMAVQQGPTEDLSRHDVIPRHKSFDATMMSHQDTPDSRHFQTTDRLSPHIAHHPGATLPHRGAQICQQPYQQQLHQQRQEHQQQQQHQQQYQLDRQQQRNDVEKWQQRGQESDGISPSGMRQMYGDKDSASAVGQQLMNGPFGSAPGYQRGAGEFVPADVEGYANGAQHASLHYTLQQSGPNTCIAHVESPQVHHTHSADAKLQAPYLPVAPSATEPNLSQPEIEQMISELSTFLQSS